MDSLWPSNLRKPCNFVPKLNRGKCPSRFVTTMGNFEGIDWDIFVAVKLYMVFYMVSNIRKLRVAIQRQQAQNKINSNLIELQNLYGESNGWCLFSLSVSILLSNRFTSRMLEWASNLLRYWTLRFIISSFTLCIYRSWYISWLGMNQESLQMTLITLNWNFSNITESHSSNLSFSLS